MEMVHFIPPSQRRLALLAAQADSAPALISGASGTGTGTIARWIHLNGPRAGKPLLTANHDRGLILQIPEAQGGTLVVPEIGEWPLGEQAQLLQFLKSRSVPHPDGSGTRMLLNVRIIATTSQALEGRAQGGLFNLELLEKLNVFRLEMPPLAKRAEEFEDITSGIVGEITRELHKQYIKGLSPDAWDALRAYNWPGNLRELRNVLRVAIAAAKGDLLELADLPQFGSDRIDFRATREQFEKIYILELLKTFDYEIEKTCRMTRIDRAQLMAKIRQYG
ncbi:MAG: sigma-54-dependent transcriptional regulator, partial [Bdellovibrionota bacterium]